AGARPTGPGRRSAAQLRRQLAASPGPGLQAYGKDSAARRFRYLLRQLLGRAAGGAEPGSHLARRGPAYFIELQCTDGATADAVDYRRESISLGSPTQSDS